MSERRQNTPAALAALTTLVQMYVANRGRPDSEFIVCITPPHANHLKVRERLRSKTWKAWDAARRALGEEIKYPSRLSPDRGGKA